MKILVVCQYYYPEPFRIKDICEELVRRGHSVTVVTGIPNYPMGKIYDGYRGGKKRNEVINGVEVHRCFTVGRRSGAIWRFLNYYSYAFSSSFKISKLKDDYDVIFVNQLSPVMMANAAIKYKKKHGKKVVLYCLDLWPESLVMGGIGRGSAPYRLFHKISEKTYKQADKILITSKSFKEYFKEEFGIENTQYLPQYAEAMFNPETCRKVPNDTVDLMFAGNIGVAQSVETILKAANLTKDISNLRWHIVGDGSELENCKQMAEKLKLTSVIFHGRKALEEMPKYYSMADAMLVTMQKDPMISKTLPGKVQTYMAAGKAIIGAIDGEASLVIKESECGLCCSAEDGQALANCVRDFILCDDKEKFAKNSLSYYQQNFTEEKFIDDLENQLRMEI